MTAKNLEKIVILVQGGVVQDIVSTERVAICVNDRDNAQCDDGYTPGYSIYDANPIGVDTAEKEQGIDPTEIYGKPASLIEEAATFEEAILERGKLLVKLPWQVLKDSGLLMFINMSLHNFGMAIVCECNDHTDVVQKVYLARTAFRGFNEGDQAKAFEKLAEFMRKHGDALVRDTKM